MKNIAIVNYYKDYNVDDAVFKQDSYVIGNNLGYPMIKIKEEFNKNDIEIHTFDRIKSDDLEAIIFCDYIYGIDYEQMNERHPKVKLYLILFENPIIKPDNYNKEYHKHFDKVFTYNDQLIDNIKYFKYYIGNKFPSSILKSEKEKLCCMIACNKINSDPQELYSERLKAIEYFEKFYPDMFDLFGYGWTHKERKSYKCPVKDKLDTYSRYKFAFCYENAKDIPGYVTEKIWDVMFSGTVPIYFGNDELPPEVYVDARFFKNYDELFKYIYEMPEDRYNQYLKNIETYVLSKDAEKYSGENFAKTIVNQIVKG